MQGEEHESAVGWADALHSKREITNFFQAQEMAMLVNWKAKIKEKKYIFLLSKCNMSSQWD